MNSDGSESGCCEWMRRNFIFCTRSRSINTVITSAGTNSTSTSANAGAIAIAIAIIPAMG